MTEEQLSEYRELLGLPKEFGPRELHEAYQSALKIYDSKKLSNHHMFTFEETKRLMALIQEAHYHLAQHLSPSQKIRQFQKQQLLQQQNIPEGFARTKLSVYEVNADMEKTIHNCELWDGPMLQRVRLYKKINLDQLSEEIKVIRSYLVAIEANDYEALPAPVFVRGYISHLCRVLQLEEKHVVASYIKQWNSTK